MPKRVAIFCRKGNELDSKKLYDYADKHNFIIIPVMFSCEQDILDNPKEEYDAILTTDTILLPIAGIKIIKVS